jgi:membrane fusion protein (multidrug efflux system)
VRGLILSISFAFSAALWSGCGGAPADANSGKAKPPGLPVETYTAAFERVEDKLFAVGSLEANELVEIKSEIAGRVVTISFDEGAPVSKGDVLFQLDDAKLRAELESAEARWEKARNNLERSRKLLEQHTISPQEFDDVQAESKEANAAVSLAQELLSDATIRSPLKGFISARLVSPGQYIDKNQTLVTVVDNDPMKIDFAVPERFLAQLHVGQNVNVTVVSLAGKPFTGEVYFIDPKVDLSTRTIKVKAQIPNPAGELRAGMFANAELIVGVRDQAVVIPEQAIVPQIDKLVVFVVKEGVAARREVKIGTRMPGRVEIADGVAAGEQVVISGQQKLRDQMPVQPITKET